MLILRDNLLNLLYLGDRNKTLSRVVEKMNYSIDLHKQDIVDLCRKVGARRLEIFGSAVRSDFDPVSSDLDFLVEFDEVPPADYAEAFILLKEGLESLFGRSIDLVTASSLANPYFRSRLASESMNIYAR